MSNILFRKKRELFKVKLAEILHKEIDNPRINSISITRLEAGKGMESVKVFFTSFLENISHKQLENELNSSSGFIRHKLLKALKTRTTPVPKFVYDRSIANIEEVDKILKSIEKESAQKTKLEE